MSGLVGFAVLAVVIVGIALVRAYSHQKETERKRRHVDIGAKCAAEAGFRIEGYSGGILGDGSLPSYTFYHAQCPALVLHIHGNGWHIWEPSAVSSSLEPKFPEKRGNDFSVSDFREIVNEYQAIFGWRQKRLLEAAMASVEASHP
jgi:hypothetical protein